MDKIVPAKSNIPHARGGTFPMHFIPKGGLVVPVPVVHIADKAAINMYNKKIGQSGIVVRDEMVGIVKKQIMINYAFRHNKSTILLFPYSSNMAYINHHSTDYNAKLRWAKDFSFYHHDKWLKKPVNFLEEQWTSGLTLKFIAFQDIQVGEEVGLFIFLSA